MELTNTNIKEIEVMIRKEIKDFLDSNTVSQFEERLIEKIRKELSRGKLEDEVKETVVKMLREFYGFMYMQRSYWESRLKSV